MTGACTVCGRLSERTRCLKHRQTLSAAARGYGRAWERIRAAYIALHPVCEESACDEALVEVDHIDGRGPDGDNSDGNLQPLCGQIRITL